ncbi:MAG: DUF58 domain-containing protein [Planctomycetes bacterium]|nr:DUF58 domain-containing protein [Planctomycetota bacterium]
MSLRQAVPEEVLERLARVGITARQAVESILSGQHRSIRRGLSVEFAGHRAYQPGDDIRHLDWTVFARSDRLDVRVYEEETRLRATIIVDCSGSMAYGSQGLSKLDFAKNIAAALGLLMIRQGDAVGLACCDDQLRDHIAPAGGMSHLLQLLEVLEKNPAQGQTRIGATLTAVAERLTRRGLVILISDCLDNRQEFINALHLLRYQKQDVRILHITDPDEQDFPFQGNHQFIGYEGEDGLLVDADRVRANYQQFVSQHHSILAHACQSAQIQFQTCFSDADIAVTLLQLLCNSQNEQSRK